MSQKEIRLDIDAFSPNTLPMSRLAEYLREFSVLLGHEESVHFWRVGDGSAALLAFSDLPAEPKIERRLNEVIDGTAAKPALKARRAIDDLLAEDNAIGHVSFGGKKVIEFPGRRRAAVEKIGPVRRQTSIEGQIFQIGGKDETINIHLRDGDKTTKCVASIDLSRKLARYFLLGKVRILGEGDFYRSGEEWVMANFTGSDFVPLEEHSLSGALAGIRSLFAGVGPDISNAMTELRNG
jgi:hypothetical protein